MVGSDLPTQCPGPTAGHPVPQHVPREIRRMAWLSADMASSKCCQVQAGGQGKDLGLWEPH